MKWALLCIVPVEYPHPREMLTTELKEDYDSYVEARVVEQVKEAKRKKKLSNDVSNAKTAEKKRKYAKKTQVCSINGSM